MCIYLSMYLSTIYIHVLIMLGAAPTTSDKGVDVRGGKLL